uniref:Uncharacterized protein n=1 Tax=Cacopsylla melanoneura TaxID=428564 RepID=A0A8D8WFI9_9HEMI
MATPQTIMTCTKYLQSYISCSFLCYFYTYTFTFKFLEHFGILEHFGVFETFCRNLSRVLGLMPRVFLLLRLECKHNQTSYIELLLNYYQKFGESFLSYYLHFLLELNSAAFGVRLCFYENTLQDENISYKVKFTKYTNS